VNIKVIPYCFLLVFFAFKSCKKYEPDCIKGCTDPTACNYNVNAKDDDGSCLYVDVWLCSNDAPTELSIENVMSFPLPSNPSDNPLTEEGVNLGRHLFYDPILSSDSTVSCASCHQQEYSFGDNKQFSVGVSNALSKRNTPSIINPIFHIQEFDWDGKSSSLESQASRPIFNKDELNNNDWCEVLARLSNSNLYQNLFCAAFGTGDIDSMHVLNAIAQFERILISSNSKYDQWLNGQYSFNIAETNGFEIFKSERGDCFHCHPPNSKIFTNNQFQNNGLDAVFSDLGRFNITNNLNDQGLFKTPTLRNVEFSAPYMHDGRFSTLEEVIEFYNSGGHDSPTVDPLMKYIYSNPFEIPGQTGLLLTEQEKSDLKAFLLTLSDETFINNPDLSNPFSE